MIHDIATKLNIHLNGMQLASVKALTQTNHDVVILSPTGTGKTLAYLLPLAEKLQADDSLQAVVLVPGRELALQSFNVWKKMGTGLRAAVCYGGRPTIDEHLQLRKIKPQIVFATPGRLKDHLDKGNLDTYHVKWLVIDEFDKCLQMGFTHEMEGVISLLPRRVRRVLLSATDMEEIPQYVDIQSLERLDFLNANKEVADRVRNFIINSQSKDKLDVLAKLLCCLADESSIVFLNYRDAVERVVDFLKDRGFSAIAYHGGLDQRQREEALYKFANHSVVSLVSTDLGSRGLDIPEVRDIIHYHLPEGKEEMIHRVGRTARWDADGRSFFILGPEETLPEYVTLQTENFELPQKLPLPSPPKMTTLYIGKGKKNKISKGDIVGFLCKTCGLPFSDLGRIDVYDRYSYVAIKREKAPEILKMSQIAKIKGIHTKVEVIR